MTRIIRLPVFIFMAALLSCSSGHLIDDKPLRNAVAGDYNARSEIHGATRSDLFGMADTIRDRALREAVTFLLAYMPLSDLAVYEPGYLVENASLALRTREEMPWGKVIPSDIFLNFVLPPRVNNENPDDFRTLCYVGLRERVKDLGAMEAALEINHWCHERVAYQAADSRTSSPLATILSARGRCGEESTLTVSALRTAGIPARQVYTPRWAHTDDNHAWVEFWVDGTWHYLGACEPEPVPDRGWFTEPARRAMLVHTKAFGRYAGTEKIIRRESHFTEINTLGRYAETKELRVRVNEGAGTPVPGAAVGYMIYNYAEFYPLARLECDSRGETSLITGYGTLLIWADDGNRFGYSLASPADTLVEVTLTGDLPSGTAVADILIPVVPEPFPGIDPAKVQMNNTLLKRGDSIRDAYIRTWMADLNAEELALEAGLPAEAVKRVLTTSMGNYKAVSDFIRNAGDSAALALRLLQKISDKDLRDTPANVLYDHLVNAPVMAPGTDTSLYDLYVLSPRISNELLSPFRSLFASLPADLRESFRSDPSTAVAWTDTTIVISESENHYSVPVIPGGVLRLGMTDSQSRNIFFVALCRSLGIPARLAPETGRPQYHNNGEWHDAWFTRDVKPSGTPGYITFVAGRESREKLEPEYHIHFTLARVEAGRFITLDYGYGVKISELPVRTPLDPGLYMLTTGNRDENGNVWSSASFHELKPGEDMRIEVALRDLPESKLTGTRISLDSTVQLFNGDNVSLSSMSGKGLVLVWMEPDKEPARHFLNDLPGLKKEFDEWGGRFLFITDPDRTREGFTPQSVSGTPENTLFANDPGLGLLRSLTDKGSQELALPVVICCNSAGDVLFSSEGYRIGTGQQMLKKIRE